MRERTYEKCPIAIVGMSCRLPGASSPDELWSMLIEGRDGFRSLDERWKSTLLHPRRHELQAPVPRAGLLDSIDGFDAGFFGISPREAARMDPQQRILLELAWEAFEDAGIPPERCAGERVGVFVGFSSVDYWSLTTDSANRSAVDGWTALGGMPAILANRISHAFDFRGPSLAVDSACSASLYGVHLARNSLARRECALALACGVELIVRPENTLSLVRARMLSPTGDSRPFADGVNGYVRGEGAGCVLLKRLDDALADCDTIYAVLHGSAVSQDGRSPGITVPTVAGQLQMLEMAYHDAQIDPASVRYVEMHGTGTPVGDPIEVEALGRFLGPHRSDADPCMIGSIKSNIGHLEPAAGIAGLIKASLCIRHDRIVPSLRCTPANPAIPFSELRIRVADSVQALTEHRSVPAVGVSAFGFGGTNVHVVLTAPPVAAQQRFQAPESPHLFTLSGRDEPSIRDFAARLTRDLTRREPPPLADVAHTLSVRRSSHRFRVPLVATNLGELIAGLEGVSSGRITAVESVSQSGKLAFVFAGMGPQWTGMGRTLIEQEPVARACIERIDAAFARIAGWSILDRVFLAPESEVPSLVDRADIGHPAHFALQAAICELFSYWGVEPTAIVGHSAGEVSSAYASGRLSLEDALRVLYHRSRLLQTTQGQGNVLAVGLSEAEAERLIAEQFPDVCIAAINGDENLALSGARGSLDAITEELHRRGRAARLVPGSLPYHSAALEPIREQLIQSLEGISAATPRVPLVSSVTGTWCQGKDFGQEYWWRNSREPVQFARAIRTLIEDGCTTFVEISAHPALSRSISSLASSSRPALHTVTTLRRDQSDQSTLLAAVGALWSHGREVRFDCIEAQDGELTALPHYAWQHRSYWVEPPQDLGEEGSHPVLGRRIPGEHSLWQASISTLNPDWVPDHRISGQVLLPAASWIEAWLSAESAEAAELPLALESLVFERPIPVAAEPTRIRLRRSGQRWTLESAPPAQGDAFWTLHGTARRRTGPVPTPRTLDVAARQAEMHPASWDYTALEASGYQYGPRFRLLDAVWKQHGALLARIRSEAEASDPGAHLVHPALLDAALHCTLGLLDELDGTYIPTGVGEVVCHRPCTSQDSGKPCWILARTHAVDLSRLVADVELFAADGALILELRRASLERIGAARLLRQSALHACEWTASRLPALPRSERRLPSLSALFPDAELVASETELHAALDTLARSLIENGKAAAIDAATRAWPELHVERRVLQLAVADAAEAEHGELLQRMLHQLECHGRTSRAAHVSLREALVREQDSLRDSTARIRILEIGGGSGACTSWLLPVLDPRRTEYVFTDGDPRSVDAARARLHDVRFVRCAVLDPDGSLEAQDIVEGDFDVVVLSGVALAAELLEQRARACRRLLRPRGLLLWRAVASPPLWRQTIERAIRPQGQDLPCASIDATRATLAVAGFSETLAVRPAQGVWGVVSARADASGVARRDGAVPSGSRWLVIGDAEVSHALATELELHGRASTRVPGVPDAIGSLDTTSFDRVILVPADGDDLAAGPAELLALTHALAGRSTQLSILTRGALALSSGEPSPFQAGTYGFARVLVAEHPELDVRLLDLDPDERAQDPGAILELLGKMLDPGAAQLETEVAARRDVTFVPRVTPVRVDALATARETHDLWQAVPEPSRGLTARFRSLERRAPERGEVEVELQLSALNFHDVLAGLGLLSRDSELNPGTPAFRGDCVGVVRRVGAGVEHLGVGDVVVGIARDSVASFVTEIADLFIPIPDPLPLEAAVTLPIVATTAELALIDVARLGPDETVLIHSGAGALGLTAIRLAQSVGARVLATAGSTEKRAWLEALGVECALDSRDTSFRAGVLRHTHGRGVDVVLNSLTGEALDAGLSLLAPGGRFIEVGKRDIYADRPIGMRILARNASFHVVDLESLSRTAPARVRRLMESALARAARGELPPVPYQSVRVECLDAAMGYLASGEHTGKIILDHAYARVQLRGSGGAGRLPIHPDATYLITGGTSGFGLSTAQWLARRGARHVALLSRSGVKDPKDLAELRELGLDVLDLRADVSSPQQLQPALDRVRASMPRIAGIFHAAMVLEDAAIANTSEGSLRRVMAPKAQGAWELHRATAATPLDFFVMYSSISRLIATPGQCSYVAANECLEALAAMRRRSGQPTICIDWGLIADAGYLARNSQLLGRLEAQGMGAISSREGLDALDQLFSAGVGTVCVGEIRWGDLARSMPGALGISRFASVAAETSAAVLPADAPSSDDVLRIASGASAEECLETAVGFVQRRVGAILRVAAQRVSMDVPIVRQGLDSLMEVELRLVLQRDASLEAAELTGLRGQTPRSIAEAIVARLVAGGGPASEADPSFLAWVDSSSAILATAFEGSPEEAGRAVRRILLELGERMRALDPAKRRLSGRAFRAKIGPFCLESSFLRRAQEKPLGYPGDFMLMKQIYAGAPAGAALARAVDAEVLQLPAPMAVRSRTAYMQHQLLRVAGSKSRARVASVGCGPAWELRALGARAPEMLGRLDVVLLDQDTRALKESTQALEQYRSRGLSIRTLSASLTSLDDESLGAADLIYSTGLFDYFEDGEFREGLRRLYRNLEPGGRLIVGNFSPANPDRWLMEEVADWHLHYRSAAQLLALAEGIARTPARVRVEGEDRDIQLYLVLDRS